MQNVGANRTSIRTTSKSVSPSPSVKVRAVFSSNSPGKMRPILGHMDLGSYVELGLVLPGCLIFFPSTSCADLTSDGILEEKSVECLS